MIKGILAAAATLLAITLTAQNALPKGYVNGQLILADGTVLTGLIRESIKAKSTVSFMENEQSSKKTYDGSMLNGAIVNGTSYRCIKGDFFVVLSQGDLLFLRKAGDASSQPSYRAGETVFINGTDGKPGDYFIYDTRTGDLKLIDKKTKEETSIAIFKGSTAAIDKAKLAAGDPAKMKEAVDAYNSRN